MQVRDLIRLLTEHSPDTEVRLRLEVLGCDETFLVEPIEVRRHNDGTSPSPRVELSGSPVSIRVELKANE